MSNPLKHIALVVVVLISLGSLNGQAFQDDMESGIEARLIDPFKSGKLIYSTFGERYKNNKKLNVSMLNQNLDKDWDTTYLIHKSFIFEAEYMNENGKEEVYTLFRKPNYKDFLVCKINESGQLDKYEIKLKDKYYVNEFVVSQNTAYLIGELQHGGNFISVINLSGEGPTRYIPVKHMKGASYQAFKVNEERNESYLFLRHRKHRINTLLVYIYGQDGKMLDHLVLESSDQFNLLDVSISAVDYDQYVLTGNYAEPRSSSPIGMYFAQVSNGKVTGINRYPFERFENYFAFQKNSEKASRNKKNASRNWKNYQMLMHDVIVSENSYYVVGESYYPVYKVEVVYETDHLGRSVSTTKRVFDGYRFSHATMIELSKSGEKLWDYSFPIHNGKSMSLTNRVAIHKDDDDFINMSFIQDKTVKSVMFSEGVLKAVDRELVLASSEERKEAEMVGVHNWYNGNFISWGMEHVKSEGRLRKDKVFVIRKESPNEIDVD